MKALALIGLVGATAFAQAPKLEVGLVPVAVQLNGKFTHHVGTFGSLTWYARDRLGLQLTAGGNWHNAESSFSQALVDTFRVEAQWAASLLWTSGSLSGSASCSELRDADFV